MILRILDNSDAEMKIPRLEFRLFWNSGIMFGVSNSKESNNTHYILNIV